MANTVYSTLFPDIQAYVASCPQPTLLNALRLSAIEFCRRSEAYKYRPPVVTVVANTPNYLPVLPTDTEIHGYADVKYDGGRITFMDWDDVTTRDPAYPSETGTPGNFTYQSVTGPLYLYPIPSTVPTTGILLSLVLRPTITSSGLDSDLISRYKETIVHGAVKRVCVMDKQVWTDVGKAKLHGGLFNAGIADAHSEAKSDFGAVANRVQIRKFR